MKLIPARLDAWLRGHPPERGGNPRPVRAVRVAARAGAIAIALLGAAIVSSLTIDLGPALRERAERAGSDQLKRPLHIGRLSIRLLTGQVVLQNFSIEGLRPSDRPFFTAKRLALTFDWTTLLRREVTIDSVELTDWEMLVEKWEDRHNFPKFTDDTEPERPKRFTTTLEWLRASRGQFTYDDHEKPWSTVARHLEVTITNKPIYHGEAVFRGGTVTIQDDVPMWADMRARFTIDKGRIHLDRIDLQTDGASTVASGDVDLRHWPEQTYEVQSRVRLARMREIFFARETWRVSGDADFTGAFHLFKNGFDLHGRFTSGLVSVNDYPFPSLYGALQWTPLAFEVRDAGARLFGGSLRFAYSIRPLGPDARPTHRFDVSGSAIDLAPFSDFERFAGLRLAGLASGRNHLEWPGGHFDERRGDGQLEVAAALHPVVPAPPAPSDDAAGGTPFAPPPFPRRVPIAGAMTYRFDPARVDIESGLFAAGQTRVTFQGWTGSSSRIEFHVTAGDWQESDVLLAGILTDFGSPTHAVAFGGRGEFEGMMTGPFRHPRVEGEFTGDDLRAWDTTWGAGTGHIVVQNSYVTVTGGLVRRGESEIHADGRFSLGFPREDGGEEIDARFRVVRRDLDSLRHAFDLDEYSVTGLLSGEFHLTGQYKRPIGFGQMSIEEGRAYDQPFHRAAASVRFDGTGVRFDKVRIEERGGGAVDGTAFVGWDSSYAFNATARQIPIEQVASLQFARAPMAGLGEFSASGSGTFDSPSYDVAFRTSGLVLARENIGLVTGNVHRRGRELNGDFAASSPRLVMTGNGRVMLGPEATADATFSFHDSSLDPYVRLFLPDLSPFTTAVAAGTVRVTGALANLDRLLVDATVDTVEMKLFDYALRNAGPMHLELNRRIVRLDDAQLVGEGTGLRLSGSIDLAGGRIALSASGDASLGILQGFFKDVRSSGLAKLTAAVSGPLREPLIAGRATITDGRIRHFALPNSLDAINGTVRFDAGGIRLDEITARVGEGLVRFGGRVGFTGYRLADFDVTAHGQDMRLRYPEGVRSTVDADLGLRGTRSALTLGGTVNVKSAVWNRPLDAPGGVFDFGGQRASASAGSAAAGSPGVPGISPGPAAASPLKLDIAINVPSTLHMSNDLVQELTASADLRLLGTTERPILTGRADVGRGELRFRGRRYKLTRGTIDFNDPTRINPFFDVEAETTVRVPGQTYRVVVRLTGTSDRLQQPVFESDPYLPAADVVALLFSESSRRTGATNVELRALQDPNERQRDILTTQAGQVLASPLSQNVGKVIEETFGVDTFQLSPFIDPYGQQSGRVNPAARLTIGKRVSNRVYLTFSRSLNTPVNDQIILLEYDASNRMSWVLSRNEDNSYALEFRVRHVF